MTATECGGALEPDTTAGGGSSRLGADPSSPSASSSSSSANSDACPTAQAECQPFEPGVHRWGCDTIGTQNELACERADNSPIARCNCAGQFGEAPAGYIPEPYAEAGTPTPPPVVWFDVPATDTPFTSEETLTVWRDHCGGPCAPIIAPPPTPIFGDAGP